MDELEFLVKFVVVVVVVFGRPVLICIIRVNQ